MAWHAGLVSNGSIRSFDVLLPRRVTDEGAAEAALERRNQHAFMQWFAVAGGFEQQGKVADDGG